MLTWVTQTSNGKCLFVFVLFYNWAVLKDLRCATLPDCTVILIISRFSFEGGIGVLNGPVPGHYILETSILFSPSACLDDFKLGLGCSFR